MIGRTDTLATMHTTRRCVSCGYIGPLLDQRPADACPHCQCDFRIRPPRSYAEMEGFAPSSRPVAVLRGANLTGGPRLRHWAARPCCPQSAADLHRWLTGVFIGVLTLVCMLFVLVLIVTAE